MLRLDSLATPLVGPVSLTLAAGEICCLSGPSGAGKSLLLRAIADLDPSEGRVLIDGRDRASVPAPEWRAVVAYVPATPGWWVPGVAAHFTGGRAPDAILADLGLSAALGWEVARLSTGERQRLALARALVLEPRVLLLDEPTAALDPEATAQVETLLRACAGQGKALLVVSHDEGQAERLADRRLRMLAGQLLEAA